MNNRKLLGIIVLLFSVATAFATKQMQRENIVYFWDDDLEQNVCLSETLEILCDQGEGACFEETSIGFRYLYGERNCTGQLSEQKGFSN